MSKTALLIEDEASLSDIIKLNLEMEGYHVKTAHSGKLALLLFRELHASLDIVLLDVMLPEINGFDLCREFKSINPSVPVIFMTAKGDSSDRISGLKLGADDYISKPFELEELLLRVHNITRRHTPAALSDVYAFEGNSIFFKTYEVTTFQGERISLSRREIYLLKLLIEKAGEVVSREEILNQLWEPEENPSSRTIDNYILSFRKYFEKNSKEPRHFHSIRGVGYKFTP